jgi:hypothetical protein
MLVSQWWSGQNTSYGLAWFASTVGLFIFSFWWFKNEPHSLIAQVLPWGPLARVHICGIQVVRRHFGWGSTCCRWAYFGSSSSRTLRWSL